MVDGFVLLDFIEEPERRFAHFGAVAFTGVVMVERRRHVFQLPRKHTRYVYAFQVMKC